MLETRNYYLAHRHCKFSLIAAFTASKTAEYVLSDDPHFEDLGSKTRWFS
jgi:hypothetical protein